MYYGLIVLSVLMFGGCFALQDVYRKMRGSGLKISLESSLVGALAGLVILLAIDGFRLEFTWFTFLMALLSALDGIAFTFCAFKALDKINLSLFSLFSMLGGMILPFLQGILFYGESMTLAKLLCLLLIGVALSLSVSRGKQRGGGIYYVGIFVLNGMSGVLSKLFTSSPYEKTSSAGYSVWIAICTAVLAGRLLLAVNRMDRERPEKPYGLRALGVSSLQGATSRIANFLLVIALVHVDASVQYPMVTGGVMIVSTLICFFGTRKPNRREMAAVVLAFSGLLILFLLPI